MPGRIIETWGDGADWIRNADWAGERTRDSALRHWEHLAAPAHPIRFGVALYDANGRRLNLIVVAGGALHDMDLGDRSVTVSSGPVEALVAIEITDAGVPELNARAVVPGDPTWQWSARDQGAYDALITFLNQLRKEVGVI